MFNQVLWKWEVEQAVCTHESHYSVRAYAEVVDCEDEDLTSGGFNCPTGHVVHPFTTSVRVGLVFVMFFVLRCAFGWKNAVIVILLPRKRVRCSISVCGVQMYLSSIMQLVMAGSCSGRVVNMEQILRHACVLEHAEGGRSGRQRGEKNHAMVDRLLDKQSAKAEERMTHVKYLVKWGRTSGPYVCASSWYLYQLIPRPSTMRSKSLLLHGNGSGAEFSSEQWTHV